MAEPFIGQISAFAFGFAPRGWMVCAGQTLPISQYTALFSILGTTFGGNGTSTFLLPNLQGQSPMHWGTGAGTTTVLGQAMGSPTVTLTTQQIPQHNHTVYNATVQAGGGAERSAGPTAQSYLSNAAGGFVYQNNPATPNTPFSPNTLSPVGNSQPHENMQPYLALNYCIAVEGAFPVRN